MATSPQQPADNSFVANAVEAAIRIGIVFILVAWCFEIVRPFIVPIIWGVIIAIATYPGYVRLYTVLGERRVPAATLYTLFMLLVVITPTVLLSGTMVEGVKAVATDLSEGTLKVPPPPEYVGAWPVIGDDLHSFWSLASQNIQAAAEKIGPEIKAVGKWLLAAAAGAGFGILQFVVAIIIAGVLMANARGGYYAAHAIAARLAGRRQTDLVDLAEKTVRSVARGILGVALIQSLLAGLGFLVAGVPAAGLWALLCLLLGIAQIGVFVILVPVIIYLFNTADMVTAVGFLIWSIPVGLIDNVLKPILLARGVKTPMVVIFIGAIGGFIASGILGLFIGAVVLALSYELFLLWLNEDLQKAQDGAAESAAVAETGSPPPRE